MINHFIFHSIKITGPSGTLWHVDETTLDVTCCKVLFVV